MKSKIISIFITWLILFLPVYTSVVMADSLSITRVSGEDRVNGYARSFDDVYIEVIAQLDDDNDITPNQLRFV